MPADDLTPRQVAERLGVTVRTVQRWISNGRLPAHRVGGSVPGVALVARRAGGPPDSDAPDREPWRDRGPDRTHRPGARDADDRGPYRRRADADRKRDDGRDRELPGRRRARARRAQHRRRRDSPRLRLPGRERGVRAGGDRRRARLGRPAAGSHRGDGRQGRGSPNGGRAGRAHRLRLRRRRPVERDVAG